MSFFRFPLLFLTCLMFSVNSFATELRQINITEVGGHPESVLTVFGQIYVSNMGQEGGLNKDSDGYISLLDLKGQLIEQNYFPADGSLNSPTAMLYYRSELIVADIDRLVRFDIFRKTVIGVIDFAGVGAKFLNDLVYVGRDHIAVTESTTKKIYLVDLKTGLYQPLQYDQGNPVPFAPNGLAFEFSGDFNGGTLYIAENEKHAFGTDHGRITALRLNNNFEVLDERQSRGFGAFIDGIATAKPDKLLVSDWVAFGQPGNLHVLNQTSLERIQSYTVGSDGFADFSYQDQTSRLMSPDLLNGKLVVSHFPGAYDSPESGDSFLNCRAQIRIDFCRDTCGDQFCQRECLRAADFSCSEFNLCNAECVTECGDQFCMAQCAVDCRVSVKTRRQGGIPDRYIDLQSDKKNWYNLWSR